MTARHTSPPHRTHTLARFPSSNTSPSPFLPLPLLTPGAGRGRPQRAQHDGRVWRAPRRRLLRRRRQAAAQGGVRQDLWQRGRPGRHAGAARAFLAGRHRGQGGALLHRWGWLLGAGAGGGWVGGRWGCVQRRGGVECRGYRAQGRFADHTHSSHTRAPRSPPAPRRPPGQRAGGAHARLQPARPPGRLHLQAVPQGRLLRL